MAASVYRGSGSARTYLVSSLHKLPIVEKEFKDVGGLIVWPPRLFSGMDTQSAHPWLYFFTRMDALHTFFGEFLMVLTRDLIPRKAIGIILIMDDGRTWVITGKFNQRTVIR